MSTTVVGAARVLSLSGTIGSVHSQLSLPSSMIAIAIAIAIAISLEEHAQFD